MTSSKQKIKGREAENWWAKFFQGIPGWRAKRVEGSGAFEGMPGDVKVFAPSGHEFLAESKFWKTGFKTLYNLLQHDDKTCRCARDMLLIKVNYKTPLVVLPASVFEEILEHWQREVRDGE